MKIKKIFLAGLFLFAFSLNVLGQKTHSYIQKYDKIATELSQKYGIPKEIILSVAFIESGAGTSKNSKVLNNHFGIVGKNNVPNYKSRYKSYGSVEESYEAFCQLLSRKKYYSGLKGNMSPEPWVQAIASAGYSTRPEEWKKKVNTVLKQYFSSKK